MINHPKNDGAKPVTKQNVVIIGGGITGTLAAHRLIREGWNVTLIEGEHIGAGSSSRTAAGIRQQFSTKETVMGMRYSMERYLNWKKEIGGVHIPVEQRGYLFLFETQEGFDNAKSRAQHQQEWGLNEVEVLSKEQLSSRFPHIDGEQLIGATYCPTDGFLHPTTVYSDAVDALRRLGGEIVVRAPVVEAKHSNGKLTAVGTPKGWIEADLFIDCTNAWSKRVGTILGASNLPIKAKKRHLWFIERAGELTEEQFLEFPMTISPSGVYCRPENGSSLMMGWAQEAKDESEDFDYDDQDIVNPRYSHKSGIDAVPFEAWMSLADNISMIGEFAGITATTSGFYAVTPDHNPFIDFDPNIPNLIRAVGFSGHGAMFGPFGAAIIAALAKSGQSIDTVELDFSEQPSSIVSITAFKIGRDFGAGEQMVI